MSTLSTFASALCVLAHILAAQPEIVSVESYEELLAPPMGRPGVELGKRTRTETEARVDLAPKSEETQENVIEREWFGYAPWFTWSGVTGDWAGTREKLVNAGIEVSASLTWDWSSVWSGGVNNKASDRSIWDFMVTVDLNTLVGWSNAKLFVNPYKTESSGGSLDSGDYQGISNIETYDDRTQIGELWIEQTAFDNFLRVKAGKIDANAEFYYINSAQNFLHSSSSYSPAFNYFPTYPDPAAGVVVFMYPAECLYIGAGWFDGALQDGVHTGKRGPDQFFRNNLSSDWHFNGECGVSWNNISESVGNGRVAFGFSHSSGLLETHSEDAQRGLTTCYAVAEQLLVALGQSKDDYSGLSVFAQVGTTEESISEVHLHTSGGLVLNGFCTSRPHDEVGCFVSWFEFSEDPNAQFAGAETAIELYYKLQITPAVSITPDLQYIVAPSGNSGIDDALVGQLRIVVNF